MQIAQNKFLRYSAAAGIALALCFGAGECGELSLPGLSIEASAAEVVDSGSCGDYVSYELTDDGVLTISGSGDMWDYDRSTPFYAVKSVIIENGVTSIGESAFYYCTKLTNITIPDSVTSIGNYAFYYCTKLTSITIPDSVTSIGEYAFYNCPSLTNITIPDSVTSIGDYAFFDCYGLTSITISESVTSIGDGIFAGCYFLTSITVDTGNSEYCSDDGILYNKEKTELICYPSGKNDTTFIIPDSVTSIGNYALKDCVSLTSITIPDSVTSIGVYAFSNCSRLTSITIPESVTSIGRSAFYYCYGLTSVTIPDSVTSIGDYAFYYCYGLTSITIPDSVTSIGDYAFWNCASLTDIYYGGTEEQWNSIDNIENAYIPETTTIHFNSTGPVIPSREEQINNFVERLYTIMLNRNSDEGKQSHVIGLLGGRTAADIAEGFVLGEELKVWNISNEEFVRRMYLTFLDREADPEGLAVWTSVLDKGCSYGRMFRDFCNSAEFKIICDSYGIKQGSFEVTEPRDINENITHYCSRMYTKALGRTYDIDGLNNWAKALLDGTETPESIAVTFLDGDEFRMWNHSDEVFVDRLYETLFNRPADADGKQTWLNLLSLGTSRKTAIETFVQSEEFKILKASLGL